MIFALVGNQNCGKTTLFNALTGSNQHVGNFPGVTVEIAVAPGEKCERCWKVTPDLGSDAAHPTLCPRCAAVVNSL